MPGSILEQERKAAIAEGLSVVAGVGPSSRHDPLAQAASIFGRTSIAGFPASDLAIAGTATRSDRAKAAALSKRLSPSFGALRAAASGPFAGVVGWWEAQQVAHASKYLTAAVALGIAPRSDLIVVARLSRLLGAAPYVEVQTMALRTGRDSLVVARRLGMGRPAARALGLAPPVRSLLRPLLPRLLDGIRQREMFLRWADPRTQSIFRHPNAETQAIAGWRRIWRRLPADPWDYEGAAKLLDAALPPLERLGVADFGYSCSACPIPFRPSEAAVTLRGFARLEAMRKTLR